ncbi:MAG TPA: hypothetical protein PLF50_02375 [Candidatus Cloacimonadota bacterium]|nr:hypothetical protein [Candidatus Cloacimonadota bacterium]
MKLATKAFRCGLPGAMKLNSTRFQYPVNMSPVNRFRIVTTLADKHFCFKHFSDTFVSVKEKV